MSQGQKPFPYRRNAPQTVVDLTSAVFNFAAATVPTLLLSHAERGPTGLAIAGGQGPFQRLVRCLQDRCASHDLRSSTLN